MLILSTETWLQIERQKKKRIRGVCVQSAKMHKTPGTSLRVLTTKDRSGWISINGTGCTDVTFSPLHMYKCEQLSDSCKFRSLCSACIMMYCTIQRHTQMSMPLMCTGKWGRISILHWHFQWKAHWFPSKMSCEKLIVCWQNYLMFLSKIFVSHIRSFDFLLICLVTPSWKVCNILI